MAEEGDVAVSSARTAYAVFPLAVSELPHLWLVETWGRRNTPAWSWRAPPIGGSGLRGPLELLYWDLESLLWKKDEHIHVDHTTVKQA